MDKFFIDHERVKEIFLENHEEKAKKSEMDSPLKDIKFEFNEREMLGLLEKAKTWTDRQKEKFLSQITHQLPQSMSRLAERISCDSIEQGIYDEREYLIIDGVKIRGVGAYVTNTRVLGYSNLLVVTKENNEYVSHYFKIAFNYKGVYHYCSERFRTLKELSAGIDRNRFWSIGFKEGIGLLKDGYAANLKYRPDGQEVGRSNSLIHFGMLFQYSERNGLVIPVFLNERECIYAYLKAVANEDGFLDYDLSSQRRKKRLGNRDVYAIHWNHELQGYQLLDNEIINIVGDGEREGKVRLIVSDEHHSVLEVYIEIALVLEQGGYKVEHTIVQEVRKILPNDKKHPANEWVYGAVMEIHDQDAIVNQLLSNPDIQVGGEIKESILLKYVQREESLEVQMSIKEKIPFQCLVGKSKAILFAHRPMIIMKHIFEWSEDIGEWQRYVGRGKFRMKDIYGLEEQEELNDLVAREQGLYYVPEQVMGEIYQFCLKAEFESQRFSDEVLMFCQEEESGYVGVRLNLTFGLIECLGMEINGYFKRLLEEKKIQKYEEVMENEHIRNLINHCVWREDLQHSLEYKQYRNKVYSYQRGNAKIYQCSFAD